MFKQGCQGFQEKRFLYLFYLGIDSPLTLKNRVYIKLSDPIFAFLILFYRKSSN